MHTLIAIGGLSGSGKSTLATALAGEQKASLLRSDVIRKQHFNIDPLERLPVEAYTSQVSAEIYQIMYSLIQKEIQHSNVIIDAAFLKKSERDAVSRLHKIFYGFWVSVPDDIAAQRLQRRKNDASDATYNIRQRQQSFYEMPVIWESLDGSLSVEYNKSLIKNVLKINN